MNKYSIIIFIFFAIGISSSFTAREPTGRIVSCTDSTDVNPNGTSELSLLMRKMYDHAVAIRPDAILKKAHQNFPKEFLTIYTAQPTDSFTKNASYNPFADGYLYALNNYRSSTANNVIQNYNNLVMSCVNCHGEHCPGPVSKIKKLLITETVK